MDRADFAARTRDYVTDYIKFADAKAGAILTIGLAVSGLLGSLTDKIATVLSTAPKPLLVVAAIVALAVVGSTAMLVQHIVEALAPKTPTARRSLASFPDIAADHETYLNQCSALTDLDIATHFELHAAQLSSVASEKFSHIRHAVWWLRVQIIGAYALVVFYVVMRVNS